MGDVRVAPRPRPVCPFCKDEVGGGLVWVCPACEAGHHAACATEHGRCASCAAPAADLGPTPRARAPGPAERPPGPAPAEPNADIAPVERAGPVWQPEGARPGADLAGLLGLVLVTALVLVLVVVGLSVVVSVLR